MDALRSVTELLNDPAVLGALEADALKARSKLGQAIDALRKTRSMLKDPKVAEIARLGHADGKLNVDKLIEAVSGIVSILMTAEREHARLYGENK